MNEEQTDDLGTVLDQAANLELDAGPGSERWKLTVLRDLRPVRPMLPVGLFAGAFFVIFVALVIVSTRIMNPLGWSTMLPFQRTAMFVTLAASAGLLAFSLSRQMSPGSRSIPPGVLISGLFVLLCLTASALFQVRAEEHFLKPGERCLEDGFPYAVPAALLFAFILRFGAVLSPIRSAALTGMLAGLVSTTALEMHCPNQNLWHVLIFHFGIPGVGAALGATAVWIRCVTFLCFGRSTK